ncbi:MAG TPA: MBL fold metallo-hydrolase [Magnetospirillaceae bacterium]|nr:MBL fold metallo-hydrolase [Magnetospirillaceae bacterium]
MAVKVKFWGVRGSIACPTPDHMIYGGNTSCIEVSDGTNRLILDAGTGLRALGQELTKTGGTSGILLLTHTHWDHICGFPFFTPFYLPGRRFRVMAGHLADKGGVRSVLASQMATPTFPVPLAALKAEMDYVDFHGGDTLPDLYPGLVVRTCPLNHPDGATAYRLDWAGKSVCYVTDVEHVPGALDQTVIELIRGADLVIYDCTYTDEEFPNHVGWGHSTWQQGIRLCQAAGARQLAIFHHNPDHTDKMMAEIEAEAKKVWSGTIVAREEMALIL